MRVTKTSILTGKLTTREIDITPAGYKEYTEGNDSIQDIFGHLSPDDREFLMTGITPEEWAASFEDSSFSHDWWI